MHLNSCVYVSFMFHLSHQEIPWLSMLTGYSEKRVFLVLHLLY